MNSLLRAHSLMDLLESLIDVLERENSFLEHPRSEQLKPVVEEKQALFKIYSEHVTAISQESGFSESLPEEVREKLKTLALEFEKIQQKNRRKLELLTRTGQHIVNCIVEAARNAKGYVPHYGRTGTVYDGSNAAPVAMNQEV